MEHLELILPVALLFLSFLLKLMIDRSVKAPIAIKAICELPVDMIFLSISFLIAFIISGGENRNDGLLYWIIYLILSIGIVFLWRRSISIYEKGENKSWLVLLSVNLFVTLICLIISINLLINVGEKAKTTKAENNIEVIESNKTQNNGNTY